MSPVDLRWHLGAHLLQDAVLFPVLFHILYSLEFNQSLSVSGLPLDNTDLYTRDVFVASC